MGFFENFNSINEGGGFKMQRSVLWGYEACMHIFILILRLLLLEINLATINF